VAQVGTEGGDVLDGGDAVGMDGSADAGLSSEGDAQASGSGAHLLDERSLQCRRPVGIAKVGTGGGVQKGGAVAHGAREGVVVHETVPVFAEIGAERCAGAGGLEAEQAAA
jgi:hypothetical protein